MSAYGLARKGDSGFTFGCALKNVVDSGAFLKMHSHDGLKDFPSRPVPRPMDLQSIKNQYHLSVDDIDCEGSVDGKSSEFSLC